MNRPDDGEGTEGADFPESQSTKEVSELTASDQETAGGCSPSLTSSRTVPVAIAPRNVSWGKWLVFAASIGASFFVHEIGHCLVAWANGCPAIPTPMKEYMLVDLPTEVQNPMALGGIAGTVMVLLGTLVGTLHRPTPVRSAMLAGAITAPGCYTLRFLLAGRGHDATEFQEVQAAMGFAYSGHAVDWLFMGLFVAAAVVWFWRTRASLTLRLAVRLLAGALVAIVLVVLLQSANNAFFDPLFDRPSVAVQRGTVP